MTLTVEQEKLIVDAMPKARKIASQLANSLRRPALQDEFEGIAYLALVEAAMKFDSARDVKFWSFAEHGVRGAILDTCRKADHLKRKVRKQLKEMLAEWGDITSPGNSSNAPTFEEFIEGKKLPPDTKQQLVHEMRQSLETFGNRRSPIMSINCPLKGREDLTIEDAIRDHRMNPEERFAQKEEAAKHKDKIARGLKHLTPGERQYLRHRFIDKLPTDAAVAGAMGLSLSRPTQIKFELAKKLRKHLEADKDPKSKGGR